MFGSLLSSLGDVLQLQYLIPLGIGTLAGLIGGALPGVTITMTIIIVLPFTFGLDPLQGLATMTGVYVGGSAGGAITAALIGIPGTPSAITTTFDGFPMVQKGQPGGAVGVRTHRGVAAQGIPLRRNRPRHHHRRFRSDHERAAFHPGLGVPAQRLSLP